MKLKVKVRLIDGQSPLETINKGDCIDLRANEDVSYTNRDPSTVSYVSLGVAMQLPKGIIARVYPRSSSPKKFGFTVPHSVGYIDQSYCGNNDEWKLPILPFRRGEINRGDRVCQFELSLSPKATMWQKIKWLFTSGYKFEYVDELSQEDRGGFGSTGTK